MWIWRKMEKIHWLDKISDDKVLQRVNVTKTMLDTLAKRKHTWLGHVLRHESLLHEIIKGRMRGKATRGRKRMQLLSNLMKERMWHSKEQLKTGKSGRN